MSKPVVIIAGLAGLTAFAAALYFQHKKQSALTTTANIRMGPEAPARRYAAPVGSVQGSQTPAVQIFRQVVPIVTEQLSGTTTTYDDMPGRAAFIPPTSGLVADVTSDAGGTTTFWGS